MKKTVRVPQTGSTQAPEIQPQTPPASAAGPEASPVYKYKHPLLELENAKNQSNALTLLLSQVIDYHSSSGCGISTQDAEYAAGISVLVSTVTAQLNEAFDSVDEELRAAKRAGGAQ